MTDLLKAATFRFATDILRRLGEELNPSLDQGLLELVKNAYDANARNCDVEITDASAPGGSVRVSDDGDGMEIANILDGWLVIGKSSKTVQKLTRLGRIPAGNKGLGRLAALRMGDAAELYTRARGNTKEEHFLKIDWTKFANADLVEDVKLKIATRRRLSGVSSGTDVLIKGLRHRVSRWEIRRLARAMILLADPFGEDKNAFNPRLISAEYNDFEKLVKQRYFTEAEYHLTARVESGRAVASVSDSKGKVLFKASHPDLFRDDSQGMYRCPDAKFELWVFILSRSTFETRSVSLGQVKEWLENFGGVHLYHNGLRVSPYGNPGHDWLDINLLRARNPEERPATNTSIGKMEVLDRKALLIQKTDRSGFIETEAFLDLRKFAMDALEWMARRRLEVAEKRRAAERLESQNRSLKSKKRLEDVIKSSPASVRADLTEAAAAYDRSRDKEMDRLRKEVQLYRTLATAGITAATFAHESSASPIKIIQGNIKTIRRRGEKFLGEKFTVNFGEPVANIETATTSLGVLGATTLELLDHEKRRLGKVEVHRIIKQVISLFRPFLVSRGVTAELELCSGEPYFRGSDAAFESVVTNLINNSLAFFEKAGTKNRKICITTEVCDNSLTLTVMDNGPGILDIKPREIWLPGQSTRSGGTGLGLTIVRDTVLDVGGRVDANAFSDLGGAEIIIEIPLIGS